VALKKYHVNPETGEPGICVAKFNCRFGGPSDHYPSEQDARAAFEREMEREQSTFGFYGSRTIESLSPGLITDVDGIQTGKLAPGDYFIGDPFILIGTYDQEGWNQFVDQVDKDMGWENGVEDPAQEKQPLVGANYDDIPVIAVKSYHGSGLLWSVNPPRRVPSDAGLVSAIPVKILEGLGVDPEVARKKKLGFLQSFPNGGTVHRDKNGNIEFQGEKVHLVVHNDTIPEEGWNALNKGDNEGLFYDGEAEERTLKRTQTYQRIVDQFLDIEV